MTSRRRRLKSVPPRKIGVREAMRDWLLPLLHDGPVLSKRVYALGEAEGFSESRLSGAKKSFGVVARKKGDGSGGWYWCLPGRYDESVYCIDWAQDKAARKARLDEFRKDMVDELAAEALKVPLPSASEMDVGVRSDEKPSVDNLHRFRFESKAERMAVKHWCEVNQCWNGEKGFQIRRVAHVKAGVSPDSECYRRAACEIQEAIRAGEVKIKERVRALAAPGGGGDEFIENLLDQVGDRKAKARDELRWVVRNIPVRWSRIKVEDIPSDYAVSLLFLAKESRTEFVRLVGSKLIPSKLEDEVDRSFNDDGRKMELIEENLASALRRAREGYTVGVDGSGSQDD